MKIMFKTRAVYRILLRYHMAYYISLLECNSTA